MSSVIFVSFVGYMYYFAHTHAIRSATLTSCMLR